MLCALHSISWALMRRISSQRHCAVFDLALRAAASVETQEIVGWKSQARWSRTSSNPSFSFAESHSLSMMPAIVS